MSTRIRFRRDTAANWVSQNPTLTTGELGYETDTGKFKIGNNTNAWTALGYSITTELSEGNLTDLKDVTITSAANGDFLRWNGTLWINDAVNLATDTIGSFVESLVAGTGITLANNSGESATPTITVDTSAIQARVANVTDTEIGYLDGVTSAIQTQIDLKAPLASPALTGTPTAPTASSVTNSTQIATTAFVQDLVTSATAANTVALGADTTGDYVASLVAGTGVTLANNSGETATPTVTVDTTVIAPLASPTFTGVPAAPTAAASTNTTQVATTAFVRAEVAALVGSAGATLDTLGEIATALGNDVALSTTLTTSIGLKAPTASPTFTGTVTIPSGASISGFAPLASPTLTGTPLSTTAAADTNTTQIATTAYVVGQAYAKLASPTFTGTVTLPTGTVTSTMILDGTIANADISTTAAIDLGKLADISTNAQTASYTLVLADKNKLVEMSNASANTLTVPPNSSVAYAVGSQITLLQTGAGQTTVAAGSGVTVNATPGLKLRAQYASATLIKRATDTWVLIGDLSS